MKNIMVVDDEVIIAQELEEHLFDMGYEVTGNASCYDLSSIDPAG